KEGHAAARDPERLDDAGEVRGRRRDEELPCTARTLMSDTVKRQGRRQCHVIVLPDARTLDPLHRAAQIQDSRSDRDTVGEDPMVSSSTCRYARKMLIVHARNALLIACAALPLGSAVAKSPPDPFKDARREFQEAYAQVDGAPKTPQRPDSESLRTYPLY